MTGAALKQETVVPASLRVHTRSSFVTSVNWLYKGSSSDSDLIALPCLPGITSGDLG